MNGFAEELVGLCRYFAAFEKEVVCCGTVSLSQCVVLQNMLDGASDVSTLAGRLGTSVSATTRLVDGLERKRWVRRTRDPADRRRVVIELTRLGREEAERLRALTCTWVARALGAIPRHKHRQVTESLRVIHRGLREARAAGGD